jgi:co-chaperonin GroES (HSP10)
MSSKIEPLLDYVLVADKPRDVVIDGIAMPDLVKQQEMCYGYVIAVGRMCKQDIEPENIVCYGPYAGKTAVIDGVEFRILREPEIAARIVQKA